MNLLPEQESIYTMQCQKTYKKKNNNKKIAWSYIQSKKQESTSVALLKNRDGFIQSDSNSMVEIL